MEIITRKEAATLGKLRYFTGKRCKNGHVAERYVGNGACVTCNYESSIEYRAALKQLIESAR
ncbi:TPA: hypothetical protein ACHWKL_001376 [Providencia stuartii]|uniref:Bacteriophage protein n=1 Tax=Providencia alcalifaciens 205/92 TaxID=1256988 RepID=A0AAV3M0G5_9GAMM|nr:MULTISPECIES: hypothetical protein [Providencia]EUD09187.1 hypothetical protein HMPREF1563_3323 [Providencia alcalifaciens 205/92]NPD42396.1 hypothetical protein [Providencia stuartii]NPD93279.1 hypothetical protein [Providencia stuartii]TPW78646.1 hypothetical protein DL505_10475 [Providencia stuartii]WGZ54075.1 hypothetical protein PO864_17860 [Providencia alcalifaciens]